MKKLIEAFKNNKKLRIGVLVGLTVFILASGGVIYAYYQYDQSKDINGSKSDEGDHELESISVGTGCSLQFEDESLDLVVTPSLKEGDIEIAAELQGQECGEMSEIIEDAYFVLKYEGGTSIMTGEEIEDDVEVETPVILTDDERLTFVLPQMGYIGNGVIYLAYQSDEDKIELGNFEAKAGDHKAANVTDLVINDVYPAPRFLTTAAAEKYLSSGQVYIYDMLFLMYVDADPVCENSEDCDSGTNYLPVTFSAHYSDGTTKDLYSTYLNNITYDAKQLTLYRGYNILAEIFTSVSGYDYADLYINVPGTDISKKLTRVHRDKFEDTAGRYTYLSVNTFDQSGNYAPIPNTTVKLFEYDPNASGGTGSLVTQVNTNKYGHAILKYLNMDDLVAQYNFAEDLNYGQVFFNMNSNSVNRIGVNKCVINPVEGRTSSMEISRYSYGYPNANYYPASSSNNDKFRFAYKNNWTVSESGSGVDISIPGESTVGKIRVYDKSPDEALLDVVEEMYPNPGDYDEFNMTEGYGSSNGYGIVVTYNKNGKYFNKNYYETFTRNNYVELSISVDSTEWASGQTDGYGWLQSFFEVY